MSEFETGTVDTGTTESQTDTGTTESFIPQDLADNQYLQGANSWDDVTAKFEQMNNDFNQMKGKKGLPSEHTAESWGEVLNQLPEEARGILGELTAPKFEAPESYEFEKLEGFDLGDADNELFGEAFKNSNITQEQANGLRNDILQGQAKLLEQRENAMNEEFSTMAKETWGANAEAKVAELGSKMAEMFKGSNVDSDYLDKLIDNKAIIPLLKGIDNLLQNNAPDTSAMGSSSANNSGYSDNQAGEMYEKTYLKAINGDIKANETIQRYNNDPAFMQKVMKYQTGGK